MSNNFLIVRVLLEKMIRSTIEKFSFPIVTYSIRMKINFNRVGEKMLEYINNKSRKIILIIILLLMIFFPGNQISIGQYHSLSSTVVNVEKNTNYIVDIAPHFFDKDVNELICIQAFDENNQEVNVSSMIERRDQQLVFRFSNYLGLIERVEVELLVDQLFQTISLPKNHKIIFLNKSNELEINFYTENGLAGITWNNNSDYTYEVYATNQVGKRALSLVEEATLISKTNDSSIRLSDEINLNNDLASGFFVLAKKNNRIVSSSNVLATSELENKIPIRIVDSLPQEITSLGEFLPFVTVEMLGGAIQQLPVYYEQVDNQTFTYSIIHTPKMNQKITIHPSIMDEIVEEYIYRQMTYPTYFKEDLVTLTLSKNLVDINIISNDLFHEVHLNHLVNAPTTTGQLQVLTNILKNRKSELDLSNYPTLKDKTFLQKAINSLAEKESYFYAIDCIILDLKEERLVIYYNQDIEEEKIINERVRQSMNQLDGSLESMYQFLITDTIFSNQSKRLTAYSLAMLAKPFGYDISVVKVVENGSTSYINKVQINNKTYYIDVSKNIMTTGIMNTPYIMKPEELVSYGISTY